MTLPSGKRPKALVRTVEREERWRQAVAAYIEDGKTPADARELVARPSPVMVWRPDQLGAFLDSAAGDRLRRRRRSGARAQGHRNWRYHVAIT